jgi:hypothetical protein
MHGSGSSLITGFQTIIPVAMPSPRRTQEIAKHTGGDNVVDNGDLGLSILGMSGVQASWTVSGSQDPPRVIFFSSQEYAHRRIGSDWAKDTLCTTSTAATTTTMRYIR